MVIDHKLRKGAVEPYNLEDPLICILVLYCEVFGVAQETDTRFLCTVHQSLPL